MQTVSATFLHYSVIRNVLLHSVLYMLYIYMLLCDSLLGNRCDIARLQSRHLYWTKTKKRNKLLWLN